MQEVSRSEGREPTWRPRIVVCIYKDCWHFSLTYSNAGERSGFNGTTPNAPRSSGLGLGSSEFSTLSMGLGKSDGNMPGVTGRVFSVEVPKHATNASVVYKVLPVPSANGRKTAERSGFAFSSLSRPSILKNAIVETVTQMRCSGFRRDAAFGGEGEETTPDQRILRAEGDVVDIREDSVVIRGRYSGQEKLVYLKSKEYFVSGDLSDTVNLNFFLGEKEEEGFLNSSEPVQITVFFDLAFDYNYNAQFSPLLGTNSENRWLNAEGQLFKYDTLCDLIKRPDPWLFQQLGDQALKSWKVEHTIFLRSGDVQETKEKEKEGGPGAADVEGNLNGGLFLAKVRCDFCTDVLIRPNRNLQFDNLELNGATTEIKLMKGSNLQPEQKHFLESFKRSSIFNNQQQREQPYPGGYGQPERSRSFASSSLAPVSVRREEVTGSAPEEGANEEDENAGSDDAEKKSRGNMYGIPLVALRTVLSSKQDVRYSMKKMTFEALDILNIWMMLSYDSDRIEQWHQAKLCRSLIFKSTGYGMNFNAKTTLFDKFNNKLPVAMYAHQISDRGKVKRGYIEQVQQQSSEGLVENVHHVYVDAPDNVTVMVKPSEQSQSIRTEKSSSSKYKVSEVTYDVILHHVGYPSSEAVGAKGAKNAGWVGDLTYPILFFVSSAQEIEINFGISRGSYDGLDTFDLSSDGLKLKFVSFSNYLPTQKLFGGEETAEATRLEDDRRPVDQSLNDKFDKDYPLLSTYRKEVERYLDSVSSNFGCEFESLGTGERYSNLVLCCIEMKKTAESSKFKMTSRYTQLQKKK